MKFRRALRTFALAASAALLLTTPAAHAAPSRIERSADFVKSVDTAISTGSKWLLARQLEDGGWFSYPEYPAAMTALCYYTLRVCGVPRDDPAMRRGYEALRQEYLEARNAKALRTYTAALVMMAIEEHGKPIATDRAKGSRYARSRERAGRLDAVDRAWMRELVHFVEGNQSETGGWRYGQPVNRYAKQKVRMADYDHSNTQYALLGLKAASRSGVPVDPAVYRKTLEHLIAAQATKGPRVTRVSFAKKGETSARQTDHARGWGYVNVNQDWINNNRGGPDMPGPNQTYGSMTAGSLGAVVICRSELLGTSAYPKALDTRAEKSIWDGIAWLGRNFSVDRNPNHPGWHYYYLYALERAGVLAGVDWMGPNDWYGEGATVLLGAQQRDGSWIETNPLEISTCFALLFLKKGTLPVAQGAVTPSVDEDPIHFHVAPTLGDKDFADFVDLVISRYGRSQSQERRAKFAADMARVGPRIVEPLIRRMATGTETARSAAHSLLKHTTEVTLEYDPRAPPEKRFDQLAEIETWYMLRAGRLRYDKTKRRLVAE